MVRTLEVRVKGSVIVGGGKDGHLPWVAISVKYMGILREGLAPAAYKQRKLKITSIVFILS